MPALASVSAEIGAKPTLTVTDDRCYAKIPKKPAEKLEEVITDQLPRPKMNNNHTLPARKKYPGK